MTSITLKTKKSIFVFVTALSLMFSASIATNMGYIVFADEGNDNSNEFTVISGDDLNNNSLIDKILENMEKAKQQSAETQEKNNDSKMRQKFIDEQRKIAQESLNNELKRMYENYKDYTSIAVFNKILSKISNEDVKTIYKGLFDYHQSKVKEGTQAYQNVINTGGSLQDARSAFNEAAKIPRSDMIKLVKELNVGVGFGDSAIQEAFDDDGKLPRSEGGDDHVQFVDLTSSNPNVNSSDSTKDTTDSNGLDETVSATDENANDAESLKTTIQSLLDEIKYLKERIRELEISNPNIIKTISEETDKQIYFADYVVDFSQGDDIGVKKAKERSASVNSLGPPNSYGQSYNFVTLGEGGQIIVTFSSPVKGDLSIYEASWLNVTPETASVEVSVDGKNWISLNSLTYASNQYGIHEFTYPLSSAGCIQFVKITDTTPDFVRTIGGFDVDAVGATQTCTTIQG